MDTKTTYYVSRTGISVAELDSFEALINWMKKNNQHLHLFDFHTSDADCSEEWDGRHVNRGFTEDQSLLLEEQFGILV